LTAEALAADQARKERDADYRRMVEASGTHLGTGHFSGIEFWALDGKLIGFSLGYAIRFGDYHELCQAYREKLGRLPWQTPQSIDVKSA
jgi:hypothetical protein